MQVVKQQIDSYIQFQITISTIFTGVSSILGRRGTKGGERKREGGSHIAMKIWRGEGFVASQTIHRVTYSSDGQVARVLLERERKVITPRLMRTEAVLVVRYTIASTKPGKYSLGLYGLYTLQRRSANQIRKHKKWNPKYFLFPCKNFTFGT